MTRGRTGYESDIYITRRKPVLIDDVDHMYMGARKAARISDFASEDSDDLTARSRNKDRRLLDDITSKMYKLDFDNVKMGKDVAMKTGFRRHLYQRARVPLERETREQRRKDELRHPWDYTRDNLYRPPKREPRTKREKEEARKKKKGQTPLWLASQRVVPEKRADPYPEHDPFGLYRPRPKKERTPLPEASFAGKKYEDLSVREALANMKAKVQAMPRKRDVSLDVDSMLSDVNRPIHRSDAVEFKVLDNYDPEWEYAPDPGLDDATKRKINEGRGELAQFEQMLDSRFGRKAGGGPGAAAAKTAVVLAQSRLPPRRDLLADLERELGYEDEEPYTPRSVVVPTKEPVVRARTAVRCGVPAPRRRPASLPPPVSVPSSAVARAQLAADVEVDKYGSLLWEDDLL